MNKQIKPGLSGLMLGASASMLNAETPPPNIIFIMADDVGYNDLAVYGQGYFPTPHTDRLASEGIQLTSAYSPSAVCTPTRYAVVTGTDPFRRFLTSHVIFNAHPLLIEPDQPTVASLLKPAGYATGVFGKWHLGLGDTLPRDLNHPGRGPNEIGFDYSFLVPDGHNMLPPYYIENGEVLGGVEPPFESELIIQNRVGTKLLQHNRVGEWPNRRPNDLIGAELADRVDAFIEAHADQPFFIYYPTCSIHFPLTPDPRFVGESGIGLHGDYVMEFDWAVGRVMDKLDELGLADNTLLIVTSDNGGYPPHGHGNSLIDHPHDPVSSFRGHKGSQFEGGFRVPFLARWPGHIAPGSVSDEYLSLVDLMATAAHLAGVPLPATSARDSFDMMPVLAGGETPRPYVVTGTRGMTSISLRQGDWKLIFDTVGDAHELYHLADDPMETTNRIHTEPGQAQLLQSLLDAYFLDGHSRPGAQAEGRSVEDILAEREINNALVDDLMAELEQDVVPFDPSDSGAFVVSADTPGNPEGGPVFLIRATVPPVAFEEGAHLFTDRDYALLPPPPEFDGAHFLPIPLQGNKTIRVTRSGRIWVLTPTPDRNNDSQQETLFEQGFKLTDAPAFPFWNLREGNKVSIYQRDVATGDTIQFGAWAMPIFFP